MQRTSCPAVASRAQPDALRILQQEVAGSNQRIIGLQTHLRQSEAEMLAMEARNKRMQRQLAELNGQLSQRDSGDGAQTVASADASSGPRDAAPAAAAPDDDDAAADDDFPLRLEIDVGDGDDGQVTIRVASYS